MSFLSVCLPRLATAQYATTTNSKYRLLGAAGTYVPKSAAMRVTAASVTNGPSCDTYTNKTTADGLGSDEVFGVYAVGTTVYAATSGGLSISTDGGITFTNKTTADGLGENFVVDVYAVGTTVYACTYSGLGISTDGGSTFTNKTTTNTPGLGSNSVQSVYAVAGSPGSTTVYAATSGGLGISTDGGSTFTNKTTSNGLGHNTVFGVYVVGTTVYAATAGGLSISTDGGSSFTNKTTADGLGGEDFVRGVYAVGTTVYAATAEGLSISTDGGSTFTNKTTTNTPGLGSDALYKVSVVGTTVYAATDAGLSISTDGGSTFTNKTTANGLGDDALSSVYAVGTMVYAATEGGLSFCGSSVPTCPIIVSIAATPSQTITSGGSVTLTASGATSYTWSNGSTANPLIVSNVTSATTLSVTGVTDACSATASAMVSVGATVAAPVASSVSVGTLSPTNCLVSANLIVSGNAFVIKGPGNYNVSRVFRTSVTNYPLIVNSMTTPGTYTVIAVNALRQITLSYYQVGGTGCNAPVLQARTLPNDRTARKAAGTLSLTMVPSSLTYGTGQLVTVRVSGGQSGTTYAVDLYDSPTYTNNLTNFLSYSTSQGTGNTIVWGDADAVEEFYVIFLPGSEGMNRIVEVSDETFMDLATSSPFAIQGPCTSLPNVTIAFPESANVNPSGPVVTVPVGTGLTYQVFGGTNYNRLIDIDRVNGYLLRQTNQNTTGIFPIDRPGPYSITVTDANGCSRTVTGVIVGR